MEVQHQGGCLCGQIRYEVTGQPLRVYHCSCHFCQRITGAAGNVMTPFFKENFALLSGTPDLYEHVSEGSGKKMWLNACENCHCIMFMTWENFSKGVGVFSGSLDDPNWFERSPAVTVYIFASEAPKGTIFPAHFPIYKDHAHSSDGTDLKPEILARHSIG